MYGRDYRNQRFSPLDQITPDNVAELRPVWAFSTGGQLAGLEATPLFRDGVLYFSTDYSRVFALDARTRHRALVVRARVRGGDRGQALLRPGQPRRRAQGRSGLRQHPGCQALCARAARDGSVVWQQTIDDWQQAVTATGAPLVVGDKVIVGIGGAEYGVRGYLKAYDAATGELRGRPTPSPVRASPATRPGRATPGCAAAPRPGRPAPTTPRPTRCTGAPATPAPGTRTCSKGDNLWSSSLLALDPDTGAIKWGYQYTPNDAWDYDGNNAPILIDVEVDGRPVKAAVQSNRNGFFYVLDRTSGEFIYAVPTDRGHQLDHRARPQGRPAAGRRGHAAGQRRRDHRADRARPRGRHQLVPDGLQPRPRLRVLRDQPLGHGADRLEARGRGVQRRASPTWGSTTRCTGSRTTSATSRRSTSPTRSSSGRRRARCRCSPACSRPRAVSCSPAISWASSGARCQDRRDALEVPDRLRDQRLADHLRARRHAVPRDPLGPGRRSELLLQGAQGRHALGVRAGAARPGRRRRA